MNEWELGWGTKVSVGKRNWANCGKGWALYGWGPWGQFIHIRQNSVPSMGGQKDSTPGAEAGGWRGRKCFCARVEMGGERKVEKGNRRKGITVNDDGGKKVATEGKCKNGATKIQGS
jgi:hypothetical protein